MFESLDDQGKALTEIAPREKPQILKTLPQNHAGRYDYRDADRNLRFVVLRYETTGKKTFGQYTPTVMKNGGTSWLKSLTMDRDRPLYRFARSSRMRCDVPDHGRRG